MLEKNTTKSQLEISVSQSKPRKKIRHTHNETKKHRATGILGMDNLEEFCLMENSSPVADFKWSIINHQSNIYIYVCIYINIYPGNIWHINYQSKTSTKDKSNHIVLSSNPRATIWWTHYIPIIFHDMSPKKPPYFLGYIPMLDTLKFPYYVYTVCVYIYI